MKIVDLKQIFKFFCYTKSNKYEGAKNANHKIRHKQQ